MTTHSTHAMDALIRVLYISKSAPGLDDADIRAILEDSRRHNSDLAITGVLCWGGAEFIQVLEGPESAVLKRYVRIMEDPRHTGCALLSITPIEKRMFKDWSMGYVGQQAQLLDSYRLMRACRLNHDNRDEIVDLMKRFLRLMETSGQAA